MRPLLWSSQNQNTIDPNAVGGQRGTPKPKPAKIDDTLKPKAKLTNDMSLLEATEWIKEYRAFMAHNAANLEHHEAKVPRELLEGNIDPVMKLKLTLSYTGSGTYIVEQGGANLPRMTFGFKNYQNCLQMQIKWLPNE